MSVQKQQDYCTIPGMSDITADEFVKYVDVIGPEAHQRKVQQITSHP